MAEAGDEVYGEDPTVNALEVEAAAPLGKRRQPSSFPRGTGHRLAILGQAERGEEILGPP